MAAALKQRGYDLSPATCGRIMAKNRVIYALPLPPPASRAKKNMPFAATRRHEYWSVDICYIEQHQLSDQSGPFYVITILDNYSRAIICSVPARSQTEHDFLLTLFTAIHLHGAPEALVSDGGSVFRSNKALEIYEHLAIRKERIARRKPWQNYVETHFAVMKRMEAYQLERATSWEDVCQIHARFVADYNWQEHFAHQEREDGLRTPREVLGWVHGRHVDLPTLDELFHARHAERRIDQHGYVQCNHWRLYGEEGLAGQEASVWLYRETLTIAYQEEPIAQYAMTAGPDPARWEEILELRAFPSRYPSAQGRLWDQQTLATIEWRKVYRVPRRARRQRRPGARWIQATLLA
jgi:hypothetical protein